MRPKYWLVALAVLGTILFVTFFASRRSQTISFAGGTLHLSWPWRMEPVGSTDSTLRVRRAEGGYSGSVDLLDERKSPVDAAHFVEHWKEIAGTQHFHPESLDEFHDTVVDAAHLRCVRIEWESDTMPLEINCVTSDGRWKIVLLGKDQDISGLDDLARQMPAFEHGS